MTLLDLQGLITPDIGDVLRSLAAEVPADQAIVEIGSYKGMSTAHLATGSKEGHGAPVFAVDPWDLPGNVYGKHGYSAPIVREEFESQLRSLRLWSRVTPMRAFSTDAARDWTGPKIGLLFIDGDHDERSVRADVEAWTPHLADRIEVTSMGQAEPSYVGGHVLAFDDIDTRRNPGVRAVVDTLTDYQIEVVADHLAVCRR